MTHDQTEAFSVADTVAVMLDGVLAQVGPPEQVYHTPASREVALFLGDGHLLRGVADGERVTCEVGELALTQPQHGEVEVLLRPESLALAPAPEGFPVVERVDGLVKVDGIGKFCRDRSGDSWTAG
mgnify:CR=1 FL=1